MDMKRSVIIAGALALALATPLAACGNGGDGSATMSSDTSAASTQGSDFDANKTYVGQWRGSVEITGQTVYGTAGGNEQMLDVIVKDDGSCEVKPLEKHADLLSDKGTWEGTKSELTLHLSKGDIKLEVVDNATLKGTASDFGIADFDNIDFDFYG
ncbi:hypothetical protein Olsu_1726 [Olsenella uli DSM 7084]|uniref:Lipoprotein n=1 Tax=Olsenella uli (strain ATCC 49627 / DSM 7084 / CCUG 31166 / CIP 109912 / JCM 12494 / LMG 11480 / NCIMB 702895 / VPI D76D-27C) TaxID=633147 RepID=E1QXG1_OLSUV|nr:hypothetical protein [Olsenella uli]ADK68814.1 hypothetical protein Olsu_1726 [Olsenella uli DSM 7084]KRO12297.1 hypothetical protein IV77_GL001428 [Olsenella uli DSM 7084]